MKSLRTIFQANSGDLSSKRVCGVAGFAVVLGIAIACTITGMQAPAIVADIIYASVALLGVDSITNIWKGPNNGKEKDIEETSE